MMRSRFAALAVRAGWLFVFLAAAACSSGDSAPAKTGDLTEEEKKQVQELHEQRQSEWGTK